MDPYPRHGRRRPDRAGVKAALDQTGTPPDAPATSPGQLDLDTATIDSTLGAKGINDGGIYKFTFARKQKVTDQGMEITTAMGVGTTINFQPTGEGIGRAFRL